jgi:hypothetical protein
MPEQPITLPRPSQEDAIPSAAAAPPAPGVPGAAPGMPTARSISDQILQEQLNRLMGDGHAEPAADAAHTRLTEAEGVLAEELSQLISEEVTAADADSGKAAAVTRPPSADGRPPSADARPPSAEARPTSAVAPTGPASADAPPANVASAAAENAAPAPSAAGVVVEIESADEEAAPLSGPGTPGILARTRRACSNLVLMVLQLIDVPFGWISELDKHVIGIAAFLLLLGGLVLHLAAQWLGN